MSDPKKVALLILGKEGSGKAKPESSEPEGGADEGKIVAMRELGEALKAEKWAEAFEALQGAVDMCGMHEDAAEEE